MLLETWLLLAEQHELKWANSWNHGNPGTDQVTTNGKFPFGAPGAHLTRKCKRIVSSSSLVSPSAKLFVLGALAMHILQEYPNTTIICAKCANTISVNVGTPELILRARSDYTPCTTDETSALSTSLTRAYKDLRRCEREIARLEGTLHALRQSQSALQLTTDCIKALLSPARKLPPELLREIAAYTLPSRWWADRVAKHPWNFTQVCRSWRSAAISTTWAWAQIRFPDWPYAQISNRGDMIRSVVRKYLLRAAQTDSPLRILGLRDAHVGDERIRILLSAHSE